MRTSFYICTTRLPHIGSDKDVAINESHAAVNVPYKSKLLAKLKKNLQIILVLSTFLFSKTKEKHLKKNGLTWTNK